MEGKTVIITGANGGIGKETTKKLAAMGAKVIMACRNQEAGKEARDEILKEVPTATLILKKVDTSDLQSVRDFCSDILATESRLDVLIHNAGMGGGVYYSELTKDDLNLTMATNHFGSFLMTHLLIELLKKSAPSRIVFVSSKLYVCASCNAENVNSYTIPFLLYSRSKRANMMFCFELAKRLAGTGVTANCLHPGVVDTGIFRLVPFPLSMIVDLMKWVIKTPEEGSRTSVYVASAPELEKVTGQYFRDGQLAVLRHKHTFDEKENYEFFEKSKELVRLTPNDPEI